MSLWLTMVACGLLTLLIRASFILLENRFAPPLWFRNILPFVPIAALTALIAPDIALVDGRLMIATNSRLAAALVAIAVAWRWRRPVLTIASGFAALLAFDLR